MNRQHLLRWSLRLIGPLLLLFFLLNSDLNQLWQILLSADPWPVFLSLALMPPFLIVKSWRWVRLLREMGIALDLRSALGLYTVGIFLGSTTPGQAGDLLKAWYLRDRGAPIAPALLSVVLDRLFDLIIMAALATLGIFALGQLLPNRDLQTLLVIAMGLGVATVTVVLLARGPRQWVLTVLLPKVAPRLREALVRWNSQLSHLRMSPLLIGTILGASLISAFFTFYRLWLLFAALGLELVPLYVVIGVSALTTVLQVLPISIAGVGIRDTILIAVLAVYGYSAEQALTLSALFLLITIEHIVIGFIVSWWYPLGRTVPPPSEV